MKTNMNTNLEAALQYARRAWRVYPIHSIFEGGCTCRRPHCEHPAKHPVETGGFNAASCDEALLRRWFRGVANVGLATGSASGLLVLDIDPKHNGDASLTTLEAEHGSLPLTPTVRTGSGGRHFYFRYPEGAAIDSHSGLWPGIDNRGNKGGVVAPPSIHESGKPYEWIVRPETALAPCPSWLVEQMTAKRPVAVPVPIGAEAGCQKLLVLRVGGGDLLTSPGVSEGTRTRTLCHLVGIHLNRGQALEEIEPLALAWAAKCSPPLPPADVLRTVRSLAAKHERQQQQHPSPSPFIQSYRVHVDVKEERSDSIRHGTDTSERTKLPAPESSLLDCSQPR